MATDATQDLEYDPNTLRGLSDHVMTMTKIKLPHIKYIEEVKQNKGNQETIYKWVEGSNVHNYAKSA
jgi:hypothetical protein